MSQMTQNKGRIHQQRGRFKCDAVNMMATFCSPRGGMWLRRSCFSTETPDFLPHQFWLLSPLTRLFAAVFTFSAVLLERCGAVKGQSGCRWHRSAKPTATSCSKVRRWCEDHGKCVAWRVYVPVNQSEVIHWRHTGPPPEMKPKCVAFFHVFNDVGVAFGVFRPPLLSASHCLGRRSRQTGS